MNTINLENVFEHLAFFQKKLHEIYTGFTHDKNDQTYLFEDDETALNILSFCKKEFMNCTDWTTEDTFRLLNATFNLLNDNSQEVVDALCDKDSALEIFSKNYFIRKNAMNNYPQARGILISFMEILDTSFKNYSIDNFLIGVVVGNLEEVFGQIAKINDLPLSLTAKKELAQCVAAGMVPENCTTIKNDARYMNDSLVFERSEHLTRRYIDHFTRLWNDEEPQMQKQTTPKQRRKP